MRGGVLSGQVADARDSDKALMLISTVARMMVGALTFVLLARYLGPASFGVLATAIAYTAFLSLMTDFGFPISALRWAAGAPDEAERIVWHVLQAKAVLSLPVTVVGAAVGWFVLPGDHLAVYILVYLGALSYSSADLIMICARARRNFSVEARLVVTGSVAMLLGLGGAALLTREPYASAAAFAVSRLIYLALAARALLPWSSFDFALPHLRQLLRSSTGNAVDNILTTLAAQADLLVFGALLTPGAIGVYQAGARLVQAIIPFAIVLSTVYLPTLASALAVNDERAFRRNARRLTCEFAVLAMLGGLGFLLVGPPFTRIVYGPAYDALVPLWGGFAAFVALRFLASAFGIQLAAHNCIRTRIVANLSSLGVLAVLALTVLAGRGLPISSSLLALSALPSLLILGGGAWYMARRSAAVA